MRYAGLIERWLSANIEDSKTRFRIATRNDYLQPQLKTNGVAECVICILCDSGIMGRYLSVMRGHKTDLDVNRSKFSLILGSKTSNG